MSVMMDPLQLPRFATMTGGDEDIWAPQYDRVGYAAGGQATSQFFSIVLGGSATLNRAGTAAAVNKTIRDTSVSEQNKISTIKDFLWVGLSVTYFPLVHTVAGANSQRIMDDMQLLSDQTWLDVKIIDKPYFQGPISLLPSVANVFRGTVGGAFTAGNVWVSAGGYGDGNPANFYPLGVPFTIKRGSTILAVMTHDGSPAISQATDIQLFLHGFLRRPQQ